MPRNCFCISPSSSPSLFRPVLAFSAPRRFVVTISICLCPSLFVVYMDKKDITVFLFCYVYRDVLTSFFFSLSSYCLSRPVGAIGKKCFMMNCLCGTAAALLALKETLCFVRHQWWTSHYSSAPSCSWIYLSPTLSFSAAPVHFGPLPPRFQLSLQSSRSFAYRERGGESVAKWDRLCRFSQSIQEEQK